MIPNFFFQVQTRYVFDAFIIKASLNNKLIKFNKLKLSKDKSTLLKFNYYYILEGNCFFFRIKTYKISQSFVPIINSFGSSIRMKL